ncbi:MULTISPECIES: GTP-binding protein [unclassified Undibacterium]|uniref:CobW family GTP-binding protein n=1 Tax=unclassified Undibacterium TaxID=2630295 RepID=UPI002AC9A9DD|nr:MULTISPECIES: GTP-binding protein [unclassified Undibacterium]MEB0141068.1 GTP-binding protein [Undibacterium sp. CCC2.1]MEB0174068.1 GTP-binding protein [Undibacterium sp. CCC1.1]MEB0178028.1 GTP-binding protein [Undibacterium sp. CCC3.4]MEB0217239.1 GTP-binding protein [Undibacterium sp. 5I2]WPX45017.1 GTP-binding protein [Undibacterium sp. CCC3.4]
MTSLIPTTILTGFLGAGKTTLLNRILQEQHGFKIAVIENEFGQENIDNHILLQAIEEQIVEMNNGCICCTVRGDLIVALAKLMAQKDAGQIDFDHVVIETTGLANPGPVAQTFFLDEEIGTRYMLDAVVTVVDAFHAMKQLDEYEEAQRQVGFADKILLSKTDLVDAAALSALKTRLSRINPRAPISALDFGQIAIAEVLDLKGFNLNAKLDLDPEFLAAEAAEQAHAETECAPDCQHHAHTHEHEQQHNHHHASHSDDIAAFVFKSQRPFNTGQLDQFLGGLVQVFGPRMLRYKGVLFMENADRKVIFQGVHEIMGTDVGMKWGDEEIRESKMVFIGKNLPKEIFIQGLEHCLV